MNSKIVKSEMVVLTGRENTDIVDADVAMDWMLYTAAGALVVENNWCRSRPQRTLQEIWLFIYGFKSKNIE
jgi:hypothetical protein